MRWMFLAAEEEPWLWYGNLSPAARERLIILGAMLAVVLAVLIWAVLLRSKRRHRSRHHRHRHHHRSAGESARTVVAEVQHLTGTRKRRRRREHRQRNPTLAETGGLPPVRPEGPAEPSTPQIQSP